MHHFVGVGGIKDSRIGDSASDTHSKDVGVSAGKQSRHGGVVASFSPMNMFRLLIAEARPMSFCAGRLCARRGRRLVHREHACSAFMCPCVHAVV